MIFNDVKAEHLGGGVVVFRNAINLDWEYANKISKEIVDREMGDMYQPAINPDNGLEEYVNRSGYFFKVFIVNTICFARFLARNMELYRVLEKPLPVLLIPLPLESKYGKLVFC